MTQPRVRLPNVVEMIQSNSVVTVFAEIMSFVLFPLIEVAFVRKKKLSSRLTSRPLRLRLTSVFVLP